MVSVAVEPLAVTRRVPKRFLDADGGFSPNLLIFFRGCLARYYFDNWIFRLVLAQLVLFCV